MASSADGPSMEQYLETRMNLMIVANEKQERALRERIDDVEHALKEYEVLVNIRFAHHERITDLLKESALAATEKSDQVQHAHNVAANEWRRTLEGFKDSATTRPEFDRLSREFAAYKLEVAQTIAARQHGDHGAREARRETKDDTKWMFGTGIAVLVAAITVAGAWVKSSQPDPAPQQPRVTYSVPLQPQPQR